MPPNQNVVCALCNSRRPRRHCPGIRAEICPICCGTSREVTIECPLDCPYLQEAHRHAREAEVDFEKLPNPDIDLSPEFISRNARLFEVVARSLLRHSLQIPGIVDNDVRDALDSLARTYRTFESGLYYESRPSNSYAAQLYDRLSQELKDFRQAMQERLGMAAVRDADILGALVALQRIEFTRNNGRPRGRAFLSWLYREFPEAKEGRINSSGPAIVLP